MCSEHFIVQNLAKISYFKFWEEPAGGFQHNDTMYMMTVCAQQCYFSLKNSSSSSSYLFLKENLHLVSVLVSSEIIILILV